MQKGVNTKAEIIRLLESRREESLEKIHQFILNLDELGYIQFQFPLDPYFAEEFAERAAETQRMLENLRDIEATLLGLCWGKIKLQ